jgi:exodeoxyribonuclease-1
MSASFLFYDLETSGFSPRLARTMQFAGQRTNLDLETIGEPFNFFIKLTPDVLPDPDAIMLTGITPQQTIADGLTEAEFLKIFYDEIVQPETIFLGFNSVRFDDEFMRFLHYRNFYDPYAWQWKDDCSRWDLLDVVRMTRALRPSNIKWPVSSDGKPTNRLELLTAINKIEHIGAHDALSDVMATIAVAKLIKQAQPELFSYLLSMRSKRKVASLVEKQQPFIYTSGHFSSDILHTSAAIMLAPSPTRDAALIYDLRQDPTAYLKMDVDELIKAWQFSKDPKQLRLPVKTLKYNRVAAVAPMGVVKDDKSKQNISLDLDEVESNLKLLRNNQVAFAGNIIKATNKMDESRKKDQMAMILDPQTVDEQLYEGFFSKSDSSLIDQVKQASPGSLDQFEDKFEDKRLKLLLPLYKARNYPKSLDSSQRDAWDKFCLERLTNGGNTSRLAKYFERIEELGRDNTNKQKQYLLEELLLYGQSLVPSAEG